MRRFLILIPFGLVLLAGCENKQARVAKLQDEYNKAHKQYTDDCVTPAYGAAGADAYFKGEKPKMPTPQQNAARQQKCQQEAKRAGDLQNQIQLASQ
jgi:hypothetical protein